MYKLATEKDVPMLLEYFERDLKNCLYSYIDLKKYKITNEHLKIYYNDTNCSLTVATAYYNGLQIFCDGDIFPTEETVALIKELDSSIISSTVNVIDLLSPYFEKGYTVEKGFVTSIERVRCMYNDENVLVAEEKDYAEIAELICSDEGVGGHYNPKDLEEQLLTRRRENFGRNYIIKQDGKIVCHVATYAEIDNLAVISGVITHKDYQKRGFAAAATAKMCDDLLAEGKKPCLFYYTNTAKALYDKVGFDTPSSWGKIAKLH